MLKKLTISTQLFLLAMVAFYFVYIYFFSVEFPFQDDTSLIDFIYTIKKPGLSLKEFFDALFRVDNDHSMVVPRLISWLDYALNGWLSFKWLVLYAAVQTILILYFFYLEFKKLRLPIFYFLPVAFFFLQPQYFEVSNFALTGIQHTSLVVYLFLALYLVKTQRLQSLILALVIASLATFTHGNGILVFASIGLYLLFTKQFKEIAWVAVVVAANLLLYLHYYKVGQAAQLTTNYSNIFFSITSLMGGINLVFGGKGFELAIVFGLLLIGFFIVLILQEFLKSKKNSVDYNNRILLGVVTFSFLTICLISIVRSWKGLALSSRFEFYSAIVAMAAYLLALPKLSGVIQRIFFGISLGYSVLFCVFSYHTYTQVMEHQKLTYWADNDNWARHREMFTMGHTFVRNAERFLYDSYDENFWKTPSQLLENQEFENLEKTKKSINFNPNLIRNEIKIQEKTGYWSKVNYTLQLDDFDENGSLTTHWFVVFKNENHQYISPFLFQINAKKGLLTSGNYFSKRANVLIQNDSIDEGIYQIFLLKNGKTKQLFDTKKKIEFLNKNQEVRLVNE